MSVRQPRPLASEPRVESPYMRAREAAEYLKLPTTDALYKRIKSGCDIPVRWCGRTMLFHRGDLDRWLAGEHRVAILSEARRA